MAVWPSPGLLSHAVAPIPCSCCFGHACRYRRLPILDNVGQSITSFLDGCVDFIKQGLCYGSVLVHCVQGVSRSASVILAFLMAEKGMSLTDALAHCRVVRPQVRI